MKAIRIESLKHAIIEGLKTCDIILLDTSGNITIDSLEYVAVWISLEYDQAQERPYFEGEPVTDWIRYCCLAVCDFLEVDQYDQIHDYLIHNIAME